MFGVKLRSVQCAKDLGVNIASNLKFSQQCNGAASKADRMLGFIKRNFSFKNKDAIFQLLSDVIILHLEYAVQSWFSHLSKDIAKLESV